MKPNIIILWTVSLLIVVSGCNYKDRKGSTNVTEQKPDSTPNSRRQNENVTGNTALPSFVLSCGSGCAMTYSPVAVTGTFPELQVKFKVEMFVDEKQTDTYNEFYEFHYNNSNSILRVNLKGKKDNVLKTLMPDAQRSFREFAEQLANGNTKKDTTVNEQQISNRFSSPEVWRWKSEDKSQEFTIKIVRLTSDSLIAQYCAVYNNGQKLDCDFEINANIKAAFDEGEGAYIGSFKSFFNSGYGTCSIEKTGESLTWKILNVPDGEYYAPKDCSLKKVPERT